MIKLKADGGDADDDARRLRRRRHHRRLIFDLSYGACQWLVLLWRWYQPLHQVRGDKDKMDLDRSCFEDSRCSI